MSSKRRKPPGQGKRKQAKINEGKQNCEKFRQTLLSWKDGKSALQKLTSFARNLAKRIFGGAIEYAKNKLKILQEQLEFLEKEITRLEVKISKTEDRTRTATLKEQKTPFQDWDGKDRGLYHFYWGILFLTIGGGGACLFSYVTMLIPAYIDKPALALFLIPLPIASTVAVKQFYDHCNTDRGKQRLTQFVAGFSWFSFSVWVGVLALMAIGGMGEDDLSVVGQDNYLDGILIMSQIIAEVFVSGSIYIALSRIYTKYNPDRFQDSEELQRQKERRQNLRMEIKTLVEDISEQQKELIQLESDYESFVSEEVAIFQTQRSRLEASAPDLGFFQNRMEDKMKKYVLIASIIITILFLAGTKVFARDLIIGLSPYMNPATAELKTKQVARFLVDTLQPGDSAFVFNAYSNESIATFNLPDRSAYRHKKVKVKALKKGISSLLRFGKQAKGLGGINEAPLPGSILWPQFLKFIGENYPAKESTDILLLGSPLYYNSNPNEEPFSMTGGAVPGDGHLSATRAKTPFGTEGSGELLAKFRVHFGIHDDTWKQSDQHAHYVQRFIHLYVERLGGKLVSFTHELGTVFRRIKEKAPALAHNYVLEPTDKLEMNIFIYKDVARKQVPIYERPISTLPISSDTARKVEALEVGLSWGCAGCDYDIHAQAYPGAKVLNFSNTSTKEGTYFKDFTSSPGTNGFETIAFKVPVDLTRLKVAVNFYGGKVSQPIQVEFRIAINGQTYMKRYQIDALKGNKSEGFEETFQNGKPPNQNWIVIDPLEIVGLNKNDIL